MFNGHRRHAGILAAVLLASTAAARADDEIQVYTGEIADIGKWTGQHHINYAIKGRKEPEFPGGLIPNHTTNATFEYAYGVTNWFEFGFYTPYAFDKDGFHSNAGKLRTLFATPDAGKREFFFGLNIEYDYLMPKFADTRFGMEIRPIIGWRKGDYEFIINPIVDVSFGKNGEVTLAPNARLARNFGEDFALAVEYYTDLGPIGNLLPFKEQGHNIYGVVNFKVDRFDFEFGVGYGLTNPGSDRWMTKLMITTDLYEKPKEDDDKKPMPGKAKMVTKAPKKAAGNIAIEPAYNYAGCYGGGYFGGSWAADVAAVDPSSTGGAIAAGTFYNAPFANAANGGAYRVPLNRPPSPAVRSVAIGSPGIALRVGRRGRGRLHAARRQRGQSIQQRRHPRHDENRRLGRRTHRPGRLRCRPRPLLCEGRRRLHGPQVGRDRHLQCGSMRHRLAEREQQDRHARVLCCGRRHRMGVVRQVDDESRISVSGAERDLRSVRARRWNSRGIDVLLEPLPRRRAHRQVRPELQVPMRR
jgi:hypothetical protein